jgi:hypothetical protein
MRCLLSVFVTRGTAKQQNRVIVTEREKYDKKSLFCDNSRNWFFLSPSFSLSCTRKTEIGEARKTKG